MFVPERVFAAMIAMCDFEILNLYPCVIVIGIAPRNTRKRSAVRAVK